MLARRVPHEREDVLREVLAWQIEDRLHTGRRIHPLTMALWNSLTPR